MPGPVIPDPYPESWPPWLRNLLAQVSVSPVGTSVPTGMFRGMAGEAAPLAREGLRETLQTGTDVADPELKSIGKRISDLLGTTFRTDATGSGLPKRLTLSNWDARNGNLQMHAGDTPFEVKPAALDALIGKGQLDVEQPPTSAVTAIRKLLSKQLGP